MLLFDFIASGQGLEKASEPTTFNILPGKSNRFTRGKLRPPKITLFDGKKEIKPGDVIETREKQVFIKGKVEADFGIKAINVNGSDYLPSERLMIYFPAPKAFNGNTIVVIDGKGQKSTIEFSIKNINKSSTLVARAVKDKSGPEIKLTSDFARRGLKKQKVFLVGSDKVEISGALRDASGIRQLTINGHQVSVIDNRSFQYLYKLSARRTKMIIKAIDNVGNSSELNFIIEKTNQVINPNETNLYFVAIGVSRFKQKDYNLNFADDDAKKIHKVFTAERNKKLFKKIKSKVLLNENATRSGIIKSFQWLRKNATSKDLIVLFIASHGFNDDDNFYILPHDGDPDNLLISGVSWSALAATLNKISCRKMLFIDACHSAKLGEDLVKTRGVSDIRKAQKILQRKEYGTVLFSAASKIESSLEASKWGHGAFTLAVTEALNGKGDRNGDGIVFLSELNLYTLERVKELTNGAQHPSLQNPASISQLPLTIVQE